MSELPTPFDALVAMLEAREAAARGDSDSVERLRRSCHLLNVTWLLTRSRLDVTSLCEQARTTAPTDLVERSVEPTEGADAPLAQDDLKV